MSSTQHSSAPGGTGPAAGIGETFNVNLSTGTATHAYSLMLPDGVAGHGPRLALEYAHHAPLGPFGLGWSLAVRSIDAALDHGTPDEARALRYLDGGAEIAPAADGTYRAVRESAFARYRRVDDGWTIEERNGVVHVLGARGGHAPRRPGPSRSHPAVAAVEQHRHVRQPRRLHVPPRRRPRLPRRRALGALRGALRARRPSRRAPRRPDGVRPPSGAALRARRARARSRSDRTGDPLVDVRPTSSPRAVPCRCSPASTCAPTAPRPTARWTWLGRG